MKVVVAHGFLHIAKHTCKCDKQHRHADFADFADSPKKLVVALEVLTGQLVHCTQQRRSAIANYGEALRRPMHARLNARFGSISRSLTDFA